MADSYRQIGADRVQIREGGGWLSLFGLPFLAAGIFVCLAAAGVVRMSNPDDGPPLLFLFLFGLVFVVVGGALVFGRAWTTVDATRRLVKKEWGLLWPMRAQAHHLDGYGAVMMTFESGDSDSADQFPIFLKSHGGPNLRLCSFRQYSTSRTCAAAVAAVLHLEFEDASTDHPQRMPAGQARLTLQQRARFGGRSIENVAPPPVVQSTVTQDNGATRIVIPKPRTHPFLIATMLLPAAIPLFVVLPMTSFFRQTRTPDPIAYIFVGALILGFGVLPIVGALNAWLRSRFGRTIVTVSTEGVLIQERGAWRIRSQSAIAAADIIDVDYSTGESTVAAARRTTEQHIVAAGRPSEAAVIGQRTERLIRFLSRFAKGRGVILKTQQGLTTFGIGLADDEIRYLHDIVRRALVR